MRKRLRLDLDHPSSVLLWRQWRLLLLKTLRQRVGPPQGEGAFPCQKIRPIQVYLNASFAGSFFLPVCFFLSEPASTFPASSPALTFASFSLIFLTILIDLINCISIYNQSCSHCLFLLTEGKIYFTLNIIICSRYVFLEWRIYYFKKRRSRL